MTIEREFHIEALSDTEAEIKANRMTKEGWTLSEYSSGPCGFDPGANPPKPMFMLVMWREGKKATDMSTTFRS